MNLNKVMPYVETREFPLSCCPPLLSCRVWAALLHLSCRPICSGDERLGFNSGFVCLLYSSPPPLSPFSVASLPSPTLQGSSSARVQRVAVRWGSDAADLIIVTAG